MQPGSLRMSAFRGRIDGIPVLLLRPDWGQTNLFKGSRIYGGSYNELEAYLTFSRCDVATGLQKEKTFVDPPDDRLHLTALEWDAAWPEHC